MEREPVRRRIRLLQLSLVWLGILLTVFCLFPEVDGQAGKPAPVEVQVEKSLSAALKKWDAKPDLVIVFSGQMHGYLQPCGCSYPQWGGLTRRYNFIHSLWEKGWPVVAVDLGEIASTHGSQAMLKYVTSMNALDAMRYDAFGLGLNEMKPTWEKLAHFAISDKQRRTIATNLVGTQKEGEEFFELGARQFRIIDRVTPAVGIYNLIDAQIQEQVKDPGCKFLPPAQTLANVMTRVQSDQNIKIKPVVNIVLYQGTDDDREAVDFVKKFDKLREELRKLNKEIPPMPIVLCLSEQSEPPAPKRVNTTSIYSVGHKGRYIGVIGLFSQGQGPDKQYQSKFELVPIGSEYDTDPGQVKDHPVMKLLEEYAKQVKKEDFVGRFPRVPHVLQVQFKDYGLKEPPTYAGSDSCKSCHAQSYTVWAQLKHAHAFKKLEDAKNPSLRQFDSECVKCHVVGFEYRSGFADRKNAAAGVDLTNVGCESCHGPGSAHVDSPKNKELHKAMNPYSTRADKVPANVVKSIYFARKTRESDSFCQRCHDQDNDVHWDFDKSWPKIVHFLNNGGPPPNPNPNGKIGPAPGIPLTPIPGGITIDPDPKQGDKK